MYCILLYLAINIAKYLYFHIGTSLIKKQTLCKDDLRNYRPISNLSFLSKILEKVVANRLHEHIYNHHLSNDLQSAYKRFHSTETALLKIHNDIVDNMDNGKVTALTLLDLSAAFDTIDHSILLQRLHRYFGISGPALRWFKSFLSDRYQSINISGTLSSPQHLPFGVPQGSVLGPDKTDLIIIGTKHFHNEIKSSTIFLLNCLAVIHSHQILFVI